MADTPQRPLLQPVLRLLASPRAKGVFGRGKNEDSIKTGHLQKQRRELSKQFRLLAARVDEQPNFNGHVVLYAAMFEDSLAPSYTPFDLFSSRRGAQLIVPYQSGYLVEIEAEQLLKYAQIVQEARKAKDLVDISRIKYVRFFDGKTDTTGLTTSDKVWEAAPEPEEGGKAFIIWLMPLQKDDALEGLIEKFAKLWDREIVLPFSTLTEIDTDIDAPVARPPRPQAVATTGDMLNLTIAEYRSRRRARTTILAPSQEALGQLMASGTVFRIEPVQPITSTMPEIAISKASPAPLPESLEASPIVGIVDGGLTDATYRNNAEVWRAPPLVDDNVADSQHGNQVTSLVVEGHTWNNALTLEPLHCRIGTVQAIARSDTRSSATAEELIAHLEQIIVNRKDIRVWNFSLNEPIPCNPIAVSSFGHELTKWARKHKVLPIISAGNILGTGHAEKRLQPPGDCEAAITVGGRHSDQNGNPAGACPINCTGPGPSGMLKPDLSHFSHVHALGGTAQGTSFATPLISRLAAHTMERVQNSSPDLVKALLLHNSDLAQFERARGFGTPIATSPPWECQPGFITLLWQETLRPGGSYYWELPIPDSLKKNEKLKGTGVLTAILNPDPMISDYTGPNYFGVRLETALQYQPSTAGQEGGFFNLLGSLDAKNLTEQEARRKHHKWSPVRHHKKTFRRSFQGDMFRIYARIYMRDQYFHRHPIPEMEIAFVLSLGTDDENSDIYNEMRAQLGSSVEVAVEEIDVDVDNRRGET